MKTVKTILAAAFVLFVALVAVYNNKSVKLAKEIKTSYTNDGKTIELEGTIEAPFITRAGASTTNMYFNIYNDFFLIQTGNKKLTSIKMNYGEGKNSVLIDVPEGKKFEQKDVVIFDKDGNKLTTSDKVKLTGLLKYTHKNEKKETTGETDYSYEITNVEIEKL